MRKAYRKGSGEKAAVAEEVQHYEGKKGKEDELESEKDELVGAAE